MHSKKYHFPRPLQTVLAGLVLTMTPGAFLVAQSGERLSDCTQIDDPERRLSCYDALTGRTADESAQADTGSPGRRIQSDPTSPGEKTQADTMETEPSVEEFGQDSSPSRARIQREDEDFELIDTVTDIRQYHHGRIEITLSSGQIWRQSAARNFHLNEGDEVRIYPSDFGIDYRLSVLGRSGFIQVQRIDGGG